MKYESIKFYWYECRQIDPLKKFYVTINFINGNMVRVTSMSSALKTAWLAYTLRTGQHKPVASINLECLAHQLENLSFHRQKWGTLEFCPYSKGVCLWSEDEIKSFRRNKFPMAYYIDKMEFKRGFRKGLLRKGDLYAYLNFKRSKKVHRKKRI